MSHKPFPLPSPIAAGLTERSSDEVFAGQMLRASHWRYLRGKIDCLEVGLSPTTVNLAKRLGISRIAIWKLKHRYPWVDAWCDQVLSAAATHYWGLVKMKMVMTALQGGGSPQHADLYCKMEKGYYTRQSGSAPGEVGSPDGPAFIINNLIPRPAPLPVAETVPTLPPATGIPVIDVR